MRIRYNSDIRPDFEALREIKKMKKKKKQLLKLIDQSRPRPVIRQRSTVFEDKKKYKRSRKRAEDHKEIQREN